MRPAIARPMLRMTTRCEGCSGAVKPGHKKEMAVFAISNCNSAQAVHLAAYLQPG